MTLPSLPTPDVYVAFNPTYGGNTLMTANTVALPASGASNSYWTNVSQHLRDFQTRAGRQHFLDRIEAGTFNATFNNRTGFFTNGSVNGTTYVLQPRIPIAVTGTYGGTTYNVFFGLIDDIEEQVTDSLNSDLKVNASDYLKYLSLRYVSSSQFWKTYATSTNATNWFRCDNVANYTVTGATQSGTTVTYNCICPFTVGQYVSVSGLTTSGGGGLNFQNLPITGLVTSGGKTVGFTVTIATAGSATGSGSAFACDFSDFLGGSSGYYSGVISSPTYGAMVYDPDNCVDLTNGTNTPSGAIVMAITNFWAVDFWVLGQGMQSSTILNFEYTNSGGTSKIAVLQVSATGFLEIYTSTSGYVTSGINVCDGYWHHVGAAVVNLGSGNEMCIYTDGVFTGLEACSSSTSPSTSGPMVIGGLSYSPDLAAYVDEIIITGSNVPSPYELQNRYRAGTLLQLPANGSQASVWSGDRIAELLCLAGFGSIVNGQVSLNANTFFISNSYNSPSAWTFGSTNGYTYVEPFYWDSPLTTSTILDIASEITDTDIGVFFQNPNGTFSFFTQNYYGTWSWSGTSGTWTPSYTSPTGNLVWTDDASSNYPYDPTSLQVTRDDADLWTTVTVTPQSGITQIYENTSAEAQYGFSTLQKTSTVHPTLNSALSTANFLGYLFRSPLPRVTAVELSAKTNDGGSVAAMLGTSLGQVVQFKRTPPNASTSGTYPSQVGQINQPMIVESISHDFQADPGTWSTTFSLDPYPIRS